MTCYSAQEEIENIREESAQQFREKHSKWFKAALVSSQDPIFMFFVVVSNTVKEPLMHFYAWVQKHGDFGKCGIVRLVAEKAYWFLQQLQILVVDVSWIDGCLIEADCMEQPAAIISQLRLAATQIAMFALAAYSRRIYKIVTSCLGLSWSSDFRRL